MRILDRSTADKWFIGTFLGLTVIQLLSVLMSPYDLSPDESHYWEWSRRLDWSYYSKGPIVAFMIRGSTAIFGDTPFAVRLPAILSLALFSILYYVFVRRHYPPWIAFGSFIALRSMLIFAQMGVLMTTDGPAALLWLAALISLYVAVAEELRWCWILFGVFCGLGVLAKFTVAALIPSAVLLLVFTPPLRNHLRTRHFWLGMCSFFFCLAPLVIWNFEHQWANLAHNAGHLTGKPGSFLRVKFIFEILGSQLGLVGPLLFLGLIVAMLRGVRLWRSGDVPTAVYLFTCLPLLTFVVLLSFTKKVYDNWPLPGWIGALLLATHLFSQKQLLGGPFFGGTFFGKEVARDGGLRIVQLAIALSAVVTLLGHLMLAGFTFQIPGRYLPTKKLVGWSTLGNSLAAPLEKIEGDPVIISEDYEVASEIAFYQPESGKVPVYCAVLDSRRMNQYDIWGGWEKLKGRDALIVLKKDELVEKLRPKFKSVEPLTPLPFLTVSLNGTELRSFWLYYGRDYDGSVPEMPVGR